LKEIRLFLHFSQSYGDYSKTNCSKQQARKETTCWLFLARNCYFSPKSGKFINNFIICNIRFRYGSQKQLFVLTSLPTPYVTYTTGMPQIKIIIWKLRCRKGFVSCGLYKKAMRHQSVQCIMPLFDILHVPRYTRVSKNPSSWNFLSPKPEVTCGTVAIIIRVVLLSPYLRIRTVSRSSIHYNQSHRVYINRRRQYICLI